MFYLAFCAEYEDRLCYGKGRIYHIVPRETNATKVELHNLHFSKRKGKQKSMQARKATNTRCNGCNGWDSRGVSNNKFCLLPQGVMLHESTWCKIGNGVPWSLVFPPCSEIALVLVATASVISSDCCWLQPRLIADCSADCSQEISVILDYINGILISFLSLVSDIIIYHSDARVHHCCWLSWLYHGDCCLLSWLVSLELLVVS